MYMNVTWFAKPLKHRYTFKSSHGVFRQLDYILISRSLKAYCLDAQSTNAVDLGSDHKAVKAILGFKSQPRPKKKRRIKKRIFAARAYNRSDFSANLLDRHRKTRLHGIRPIFATGRWNGKKSVHGCRADQIAHTPAPGC